MRKKLIFMMLLAAYFLMMPVCPLAVRGESDSVTINPERRGSITIHYETVGERRPISGTLFVIRRVAVLNTEIFDKDGKIGGQLWIPIISGIKEVSKEDTSVLLKKARKQYEKTQPEDGRVYFGTTDHGGCLVISSVDPGLYVVEEEEAVEGYFLAEPFVISVPFTDIDFSNGAERLYWRYDVTAMPKPRLLTSESSVSYEESPSETEYPLSDEPQSIEYPTSEEEQTSDYTHNDDRLPPQEESPVIQLPETVPNTEREAKIVKTGDLTSIVMFAMVGLFSVVFAVGILIIKSERRDENDDNKV